MSDRATSRRRFVATVGTTGIAVGLAGCSGGDGDGSGNDGNGDGGNGGDDSYSAAEQRVVEYLNDDPAEGTFDGSFADETGADEVVVTVGADGNGADYAYAPPALRVSTGATISFEWAEGGSQHNVVSEDISDVSFDSGDTKQEGDPFVQSFDEPGVALYYCTPHRGLGMKGGIVVVE
jgi:serine/threonine-protein kinase